MALALSLKKKKNCIVLKPDICLVILLFGCISYFANKFSEGHLFVEIGCCVRLSVVNFLRK